MGYWENKRTELINNLPTILDVLNQLAYGEEKWALEKTPLRMLQPYYEHEGKFEIVTGPDAQERLFHVACLLIAITEERVVIISHASLHYIVRE